MVGAGGWTAVLIGGELAAYVRFTLNDEQSFRIAEVRVLDPENDSLRRIPLARITTIANASSVRLALAVTRKRKPPADVPEYFREGSEHIQAGRWILRRPTGRRLDNDFYADVARAYTEAAGL